MENDIVDILLHLQTAPACHAAGKTGKKNHSCTEPDQPTALPTEVSTDLSFLLKEVSL